MHILISGILVYLSCVDASHFIGGYLRADLVDNPAQDRVDITFYWNFTMVSGTAHSSGVLTLCASGTTCPQGPPSFELSVTPAGLGSVCQLTLEADTGSNSNYYIPYSSIGNISNSTTLYFY